MGVTVIKDGVEYTMGYDPCHYEGVKDFYDKALAAGEIEFYRIEKWGSAMLVCNNEGKKVFYSRKAAHNAVRKLNTSVRVYQCDCKKHYHVTKQYKSWLFSLV